MRVHLIVHNIEPERVAAPDVCPYDGCDSTEYRSVQTVTKRLRDTLYHEVSAQRYQCLGCERTFRVYPRGVGKAYTSQPVKHLAVLLYTLGLSYGKVSSLLHHFRIYLSKSRVFEAVREIRNRSIDLTRQPIFEGIYLYPGHEDAPKVKYRGRWLAVDLRVDQEYGTVLTINSLTAQEAVEIRSAILGLAADLLIGVQISDDEHPFFQERADPQLADL